MLPAPATAAPRLWAMSTLEGTWSEVYPNVTQDEAGLKKLFTQFSFPGGISSHVAPTTPGSIHEGGELGYSLSHAFGAAFDNPGLIVACVVGDGEAETGPWRLPGSPTSCWTRSPTGPCCRSCTSTATRSATRPSSPASSRMSWSSSCAAAAGRPTSWKATIRRNHARADGRRHGNAPWRTSKRIQERTRGRMAKPTRPAPLADDRPALAQGLDRAEGCGRPARSRGRSGRTRCRSWWMPRTRTMSRSLKAG